MWRRLSPRSHAPAGAGATPAIERIDPLTGEAVLGGSPFARWPGFDLVFSFPWPGRARSRHRLVLERALAERPPETRRGLTSETTCVPRDRDAQRAARSARRTRAPRLSQSRGNERKSRRGGCCRCSSEARARGVRLTSLDRHTSPNHPYGTPPRGSAAKSLLRTRGVRVGVPLPGSRCGAGNGRTIAWTAHDDESSSRDRSLARGRAGCRR